MGIAIASAGETFESDARDLRLHVLAMASIVRLSLEEVTGMLSGMRSTNPQDWPGVAKHIEQEWQHCWLMSQNFETKWSAHESSRHVVQVSLNYAKLQHQVMQLVERVRAVSKKVRKLSPSILVRYVEPFLRSEL